MVETDLPAIWGHAAGSRKSLTLLRFDSFRYLTARLTLPGGLRQLGQDQHQQSSENLKHQNTVTENTAKDPKQYASFSFVPLMSLLRRCLYLLKYTMKNSLNGKKSVFHLLLNSHTYFLKCIAKKSKHWPRSVRVTICNVQQQLNWMVAWLLFYCSDQLVCPSAFICR